MKKKIFLKIVLILSLIIITWFVYSEYFKEDKSKLSKLTLLQKERCHL
jgi:hypothetical protein